MQPSSCCRGHQRTALVVALVVCCVARATALEASPFEGLAAAPAVEEEQQQQQQECAWPRGGRRCCGTLRTPGAAHGWRGDETDHCFPASASDHAVCCVDIKNLTNAVNDHDPAVAAFNPLAGPIMRNSHASSYSWCTCSVTICEKQLGGRVAWVGSTADDEA